MEHSRESTDRGHAVPSTDKTLRCGETKTERLRVGEESGLEPRSAVLVIAVAPATAVLCTCDAGFSCVPQSPLVTSVTCHPGVTYSQLLCGYERDQSHCVTSVPEGGKPLGPHCCVVVPEGQSASLLLRKSLCPRICLSDRKPTRVGKW